MNEKKKINKNKWVEITKYKGNKLCADDVYDVKVKSYRDVRVCVFLFVCIQWRRM